MKVKIGCHYLQEEWIGLSNSVISYMMYAARNADTHCASLLYTLPVFLPEIPVTFTKQRN